MFQYRVKMPPAAKGCSNDVTLKVNAKTRKAADKLATELAGKRAFEYEGRTTLEG